jgi:hypothetical protein
LRLQFISDTEEMEKVTIIEVEGVTCKGIINLEVSLRGNDMSKLASEKGLNSLEVSFRGRGYDMSVLLKLCIFVR